MGAVEVPLKSISVCVKDIPVCSIACRCISGLVEAEPPPRSVVLADIAKHKGMACMLLLLIKHPAEARFLTTVMKALADCSLHKGCAQSVGKRGVEVITKLIDKHKDNQRLVFEAQRCLDNLTRHQ
eukprot:GHVQ01012755.1.p1 GENE.GHVQ01012755.1~~GHVQ01012755.1.p1  ORF type:complete len:126 (+),score=20.90 GHVQ01012755.1:419-796(+)